MKQRWRKCLVWLPVLLLALLLAGCGGDGDAQASPGEETETPVPSYSAPPLETPSPSPSPSPSPTPDPSPSPSEPEPAELEGVRNPLTGEPVDEETANARPVAIMLNNLTAALPQQGNGGADIIYEVVAEGGITRMVGIYQSLDGVGIIGSVRSARPYFIELALGHDAVFVHAGASEAGYADLTAWNVDHMDGVNGRFSWGDVGLFWRSRNRIAGKTYAAEHSLVTSGEKLQSVLAGSGFRLEHEEDFAVPVRFAEDGTPEEGEAAGTVTAVFPGGKRTVFDYDAESGLYRVSEYGGAYVDGNTGEQIAVTNVLVLRTRVEGTGDWYNHMDITLDSGDGWFACGGKLIPITWEKGGPRSPLTYCTQDGNPLTLEIGKSYVCIVSQSAEVLREG